MAPPEEPLLLRAVRYAELLFAQGLEMRAAIVRASATYGVPARVLIAAIEEVRSDGPQ